jgi:hypothetical protein
MQVITRSRPLRRYVQGGCLLLILMIGMFLRFGTAVGTKVDGPIRNDAKEYVAYAWNLKYLGVYSHDFSGILTGATNLQPDAERPPGYPLLLSALLPKYIDGLFIYRVAYVQAWIATLTLLIAALLAIELLGVWAGLMVGLLVALSPHQSVYIPYLLTETLFGAAVMAAVGLGVLALKAKRPRWRYVFAVAAGLCFGLSCLVRLTLNQWVPVLVLLLLFPYLRRFRREIAALAFGFVLMMSPWWLRNENTLHRFSGSSAMLVTIQQGSYPDLMYENRPDTFGYPYRFDPAAVKIGTSWTWTQLSADLRDKFEEHPLAMIRWYLFGKIYYFFDWSSADGWADMFTYAVWRSPWIRDPTFVPVVSVMKAVYVPLIVCGLLGTLVAFLPATRRLFGAYRVEAIRFLALLHLFAIGVHVAGLPLGRYSVPFRPITFLLAIFFIVWLCRSYLEQKGRISQVAIAHE